MENRWVQHCIMIMMMIIKTLIIKITIIIRTILMTVMVTTTTATTTIEIKNNHKHTKTGLRAWYFITVIFLIITIQMVEKL